jgi:uncharacterized membrane protein
MASGVGEIINGAPPARATAPRLTSIDAVRGAIMIIMALDHVRDYVYSSASQFSPTDLTHTTAALFFTRWITHLCAPVFMLYAGTAAFLWARRGGRTTRELSQFLVTRGLWLIFLELTVVRFAMFFNVRYDLVLLVVFWALGWSMIALAALVFLPYRVLLAVSLLMIACHNLLDGVKASMFGSAGWLWNVLHQPGPLTAGGPVVILGYPLIPWMGVMAAGYCLGRVFTLEPDARQAVLLRLGTLLTAAFVLLRAANVYGDPAPWSQQPSVLFTGLSFLNCTKYPPSLLFLLMTLGPALLATGWLERFRIAARNPVVVFGRVPLFYFVLHLFVLHAVAAVLIWLAYGNANLFWNASPAAGGPVRAFPNGYGFNLWVVYAVWILVVALTYPACRWFAELKRRRRDWWLSYC